VKTPQADLLLLIAVLLPPFALDALGEVVDEQTLSTPYGPFGPLALRAVPGGPPVWVAPYTGSLTRTDPRAAVYTARALGAYRLLIWDGCTALNPVLPRGITAVVTDYLDWTRRLPATFGAGPKGRHPSPADLSRQARRTVFCPDMLDALRTTFPASPEITYLGIDDMRRETPAEARMFRLWGADVIGRNLVPEVALARELGLCIGGLVTVDDFGADRPAPEAKGEVRAALEYGIRALSAVARFARRPPECDCDAPVPTLI
jgi:purine nucleoside phosphorylase